LKVDAQTIAILDPKVSHHFTDNFHNPKVQMIKQLERDLARKARILSRDHSEIHFFFPTRPTTYKPHPQSTLSGLLPSNRKSRLRPTPQTPTVFFLRRIR
jgi:hypothetical protein